MFWKVTNLNEISFLMDYDFPNFNVNLADFKLSPCLVKALLPLNKPIQK